MGKYLYGAIDSAERVPPSECRLGIKKPGITNRPLLFFFFVLTLFQGQMDLAGAGAHWYCADPHAKAHLINTQYWVCTSEAGRTAERWVGWGKWVRLLGHDRVSTHLLRTVLAMSFSRTIVLWQ